MQSQEIRPSTAESQAVLLPEPEGSDTIILKLEELIRYLWCRRWRIAAVCFICCVLVGVWSLAIYTPPFKAVEKLYVIGNSNSIIDLSALELGSSLSADYQQVFTNKDVHEQMRNKLPFLEDYTDDDLDRMITLSTAGSARILQVSVTSDNPAQAKRMVEEYCDAARNFIESKMDGRYPSIFQGATVDQVPRGTVSRVVITLLLSALAMVIFYILLFFFDDRIQSSRFFQGALDMPVLCVLPGELSKKQLRASRDRKLAQ